MKTERWIIDGNKLFNLIRDDININGSMFARVKTHMNDASLTDTKEAAHGRWIWKDGKCFCSVCNKQGEPKFVYQDGTVDEYPYCPNCGVRMDLED